MGWLNCLFLGQQHQIYFTRVVSLIQFLPRVVLFKIPCFKKHVITI